VTAIRRVMARGRYVSLALAERLAADLALDKGKPLHETLTEREIQVLCMIAAGKSVTEVADGLALSVKTIGA
jgi:DNA-binding NarL/FixJ family response regulator